MSRKVVLNEVLFKLEGVCMDYGGVSVLRDITEEIRDIHEEGAVRGQVLGILGKSGCGKSTLLRIMAGMVSPTCGRVLVTDRQILVRPGLVGVVAQNYPLFRHRTVLGNVMVGARTTTSSRSEARDKAMTMLERFGLADKVQQFPSQLSGGQRQRVAIVQQMVCSENLLLMDEPFTGLDPLAKRGVCRLIADVAGMDEKNTIVVVAHDVRAVAQVADTIWVLGRETDDKGAIIPGSRVTKHLDLVERDLAWNGDISRTNEFADFVFEVEDLLGRLV